MEVVMSSEDSEFLTQLKKINAKGSAHIRHEKKEAFASLLKLVSSTPDAEKLDPSKKVISKAYLDALASRLKNYKKVFNYDSHQFSKRDLEDMSEEQIKAFEDKLLEKYIGIQKGDLPDLATLAPVLKSTDEKRSALEVKNRQLDLEIKQLAEQVAEIAKIEVKIKSLDRQLEEPRRKSKAANVALTIAKDEEVSGARDEKEKCEKELSAMELKVANEKKNEEAKLTSFKAPGKSIAESIAEIKANLPVKRRLREANQKEWDALELKLVKEALERAEEAKKKLTDTRTSAEAIKAAEEYELKLSKLRKLTEDEKVNVPLEIQRGVSAKSQYSICLSTGGGHGSNMVKLDSDPEWTVTKSLDISEAFKELPVEKDANDNFIDYDALESGGDEAHRLVLLEKGGAEVDFVPECILAKRNFGDPASTEKLIVLKQELKGAKVSILTDVRATKNDPRTGSLVPIFNGRETADIAMMQARMLLDNYKPGYTRIVIRIIDPRLATQVHAALLLMIKDSAAKNCVIVNKNKRCAVPGYFNKKFIEERLGHGIFEEYKAKYQPQVVSCAKAMQTLFAETKIVSKNRESKEPRFEESEGQRPGSGHSN